MNNESEAQVEKPRPVHNPVSVAANKEIKELKTVSSSPFKNTNNQPANSPANPPVPSSTVNPNKPPTVGKLKISQQFLQTSSSVTSTTPNGGSNLSAVPEPVQPSEPEPVSAPAPAPPPPAPAASNGSAGIVYQPPSFLRQTQHSDNEDDEWADNADPIKITPSHAAPLATYDDHEDQSANAALNNNNNIHHQEEEFNSQQSNGAADTGLTAVAIYDYQAADEDEISFDPSDVITNIVKVHNFNPLQNHLFLILNKTFIFRFV